MLLKQSSFLLIRRILQWLVEESVVVTLSASIY